MEGERERKRETNIPTRHAQEMTRSWAQRATIILTNETIIPWDRAEREREGPLSPSHPSTSSVASGPELGDRVS